MKTKTMSTWTLMTVARANQVAKGLISKRPKTSSDKSIVSTLAHIHLLQCSTPAAIWRLLKLYILVRWRSLRPEICQVMAVKERVGR